MENLFLIPIFFICFIILVLFFCFMNKCKKKKIVKRDIDITEISKICSVKKNPPSNTKNDDSNQYERIKNHLNAIKLNNTLQDAHRSPTVNDSVFISMIIHNSSNHKKSNNQSVIIQGKGERLKNRSKSNSKLAVSETNIVN